MKSQGEGQFDKVLTSLMKLNGATGINSYKLARFVNNYVTQVQDQQDLQENLGSVDRIERTIFVWRCD